MNEIIFEILKCVVIVAIILITRYAIPLLRSKIEQSKYAELVEWVKEAVRWAEQTMEGGAFKKEQVVAFLTTLAFEKGINISQEQLDVLIEAAVKAMKGGA